MKKIWILTMFPEMFDSFIEVGVVGQALTGKRGMDFEINLIPISKYSSRDFKGVDAAPYGGGPGMVMRADVLKEALFAGVIKEGNYGENYREKLHIVFPGPRGKTWNNQKCRDFSENNLSSISKDLVFVCGRYEGIDERFLDEYVDEEISIGDYVLTGGELATMVILDAALRFSPNTLGNNNSAMLDSFEGGLLEHPQYTRPQEFNGIKVPEILMSGHHKNIDNYRKEEKLRITKKYRPDLLKGKS